MVDEQSDIPIDDLIARGLYDPEAPDAADRLFALEYLLVSGVTVQDIADAGGGLHRLGPARRLRPGGAVYTLAEAAARAGVSTDTAVRVNRASGFPDPEADARLFGEEDVEVFATFEVGCAFFGEELMLQLGRVFGLAMSRVADTMVSLFMMNVGSQNEKGEIDGRDLARANDTAVALIPSAVRALDVLLRRHMEARTRPEILRPAAFKGVDTVERAIGFCDLVGYTSVSGQLATTELAQFLTGFEGRASEIIVSGGGQVVKLIGDEVMFVAPDPATACKVALGLVDGFARDETTPVRVGIAAGTVLFREGDYYGPVVNLAARLVKHAAPGGVLAPADFRDIAGDAAAFEDFGTSMLKGFDEPVDVVAVRAR